MNHHRPNDYKTPRTMSQAFGPYAELHTTRASLLVRICRFIGSMFR